MDSAIITPIRLIKAIDREFNNGFHVCYADLIESSETYRTFYKEKSLRGEFVILQYSSVEPRYITSEYSHYYLLQSVIEYLSPDLVIIPYSDLGYSITVETAKVFSKFIRDVLGNVPLMGMVQGSSDKEILDCIDEFRSIGLVALGLPSVISPIMKRSKVLEVLKGSNLDLPVYLADIWESFNEVSDITSNGLHSLVEGGWSTLPLRLAYQDREVKAMGKIRPDPPPLDFNIEHIPSLIIGNLEDYQDIYAGRTI